MIDQKLIKYVREIGQGSFGIIYKGTYAGKPVAIKQLRPEDEEKYQDDFKKEIENAGKVKHECLVTTYGYCCSPYAIVMELMDVTLYDVLKNSNVDLPWRSRYAIAMDVISGLWVLHANNIIHCDLKSINILLKGQWRAKLSDFGFAKTLNDYYDIHLMTIGNDAALPDLSRRRSYQLPVLVKKGDAYHLYGRNSDDSRKYTEIEAKICAPFTFPTDNSITILTRNSVDEKIYNDLRDEITTKKAHTPKDYTFGTPGWIAPEVYQNMTCTKQSDIFSLGVVLYELASRTTPFAEAKDYSEIDEKVCAGNRPDIPAECSSYRPKYAALIKFCWAQDPQTRPDAEKAQSEIQEIIDDESKIVARAESKT